MDTIKRITKNTAFLFFANVIGKILGFFFIMYTARYLGAEGFGVLSFAIAFTGLFAIFADMGLYELTIREVARDRSIARKYLGNVTIIKTLLVMITFGLIVLTINFMGYPPQTVMIVYIISLSVVLDAFSVLLNSIFQAFERMEYVSIGKVLHSVLLLLGALFIIHQGFSILAFALLYLFVSTVELIYSLIITAKKFVMPRLEIDLRFWKWLIKEALPFWLSGVFWIIYFRIDSVMLSMLKGNVAVGWYNASFQLIHALGFIHTAFIAAIFPVTSRFYKTSKENLRFAFEMSFKYLFMIIFPIAIGTTLLADRFISIIYGSEYIPSTIALQILIWAEVLIFINVAFGNLLNSINRQVVVTKVTGILAVSNVIMNLLLIPAYSYVGAGIATVATELLGFIFLFAWISRSEYRLPTKIILNIVSKVIMAGLLMGAFTYCFKEINLALLIVLSAIIYFIILFIVKGIDETDKRLAKRLLDFKGYNRD